MHIRVEAQGWSDGHLVYIDGTLIGLRPYDGTHEASEIRREVTDALAEVLRDKLDWKPAKEED